MCVLIFIYKKWKISTNLLNLQNSLEYVENLCYNIDNQSTQRKENDMPKKSAVATATISKTNFMLSDIIDIKFPAQMEIFKDGPVERDAFGNLLINIGYIRVSTDKQADEGFGLDVQRDRIKKYIDYSENEVNNLLLFIDAGITGTTMDRPAIKMIINMIEQFNSGLSKIKIKKMIVPRIDRLSRSLLGALNFIQDYLVSANTENNNSLINRNKEDIEFISVDEKFCRIERDNPHGKFLFIVFAGLAEFDRDVIVKKMRDGKQKRILSGKWFGGGNRPYGYTYDKKEETLKIVPDEATKIKEVFRLFIEESLSPQKIADRLGFKSDTVVRAILKRKSLTGCIIANMNGQEVEIPNAHEPIISLERWNQAQDMFDTRKTEKSESSHMLKGLCVCGECGAKMRYHRWSGNHKIVCYSHCASKSQQYLVKDKNCPNEKFWAEDIENAVIQELFRLSYLGNETTVSSENLYSPIERLEQEKTECFKELENVIKRLSKMPIGSPSAIVYEEREQELNDKIMRLDKQIEREREEQVVSKKIENAKAILRDLKDSYPKMTPMERQATCKELIDKIIIKKDYTLDVHLKLKNYLINNSTTA